MHLRKRSILGIGLFCVLLITLFVAVCNWIVVSGSSDRIVTSVERAAQAQTALVLGAKVYKGGLVSPILRARLDAGLKLYEAGKVERFLLSGDHGEVTYNEVQAMGLYLIKNGVPPAIIFLDHAGFDTYDSVYRAKKIFGVKNMIIISQRFHLLRALFVADALDVPAMGFVASDESLSTRTKFYNAYREIFARTKAFIEVLLRFPPKFLGDPIPITGDGRTTQGK